MFNVGGSVAQALEEVQQVCTSTASIWPWNRKLDELDTKYLKVKKIRNGIFIKRFYNQKALKRLERLYLTLWWKEIRKDKTLV
jgi:hypothetical protein